MPKTETKYPGMLHIRVGEDFCRQIDDLRSQTRPLRGRAEVIRDLVEREWQKQFGGKSKGK